MQNYTDQQITEMYENLPQDLRDAIFSVGTNNVVQEIGGKYKLMIDKVGILGNETGMVMLGVTHPNDFIANLARRLEVDKQTAHDIAQDINQQIFQKVRESLRKVHGMGDEKEASQPIPKAPLAASITGTGMPPAATGAAAGANQTPPPPKKFEIFDLHLPKSQHEQVSRDDILKEIEKDDAKAPPNLPTEEKKEEQIPDILRGVNNPRNPFEAKLAGVVFKAPKEEKNYEEGPKPAPKDTKTFDPYREQIG